MTADLNSVKTASGRYHHGALRQALLNGAEAILTERGIEGFSLREAARRAGVSPAAPAHHFGDTRGLLTALAAEAFRRFGDALEAADRTGRSRIERVRAQGRAYVAFALDCPALFHLMWRRELLDNADEQLLLAGQRAFGFLQSAVEGSVPRLVERSPEDPIDPAALASWSIVHGFALLTLGGALGEGAAAEERARLLLPQVLEHLEI